MIKVEVTEGAIEVKSPYCEEFVDFAHMRGGAWSDSKEIWMFDKRDEFAVRTALNDIYGTDDYESCEKVDLRFDFYGIYRRKSNWQLFACGRWFVRNKWDDVKLANNAVVIEGDLYSKGNKVKGDEGTIIELRAIPKRAAEKFKKEYPEHVEIIGGLDIQKLKDEKKEILKRVVDIEETIEMLEQEPEEGGIIDDLQD